MTDHLLFESILYAGAVGLVIIGIAGIVLTRDLFRVVLALAIAEAGGNLLLVLAGYRWDAVAPILSGADVPAAMVDPVPQAMVLTAIVIGVGIQALAVSLLLRVRRAYGTLDRAQLVARLDQEIAEQAGIQPVGSLERPAGQRPLPLPKGDSLKEDRA